LTSFSFCVGLYFRPGEKRKKETVQVGPLGSEVTAGSEALIELMGFLLMNSKIQPIFIAAMVRKIVRYLLETYCLSTFVSFLAFNTNVNLFIRSKINVDRRL
jgi:hypothetical protein